MIDDRRWIRDTLAHRQQEAVPYNFMFSPPARSALQRHFGAADLEEALAFPIRMSSPDTVKPLYADPCRYGDTLRDEYGVVWTASPIDRGAPVGPCLSKPDLRGYRFPSPAAEYRFAGLGDWCRRNRDHFTILWVGDLWERATFMRGMEEILLDVALRPRFVRRLLEGIAGYILETMRILFARFQFDGIAVSDDYGTQGGLIMAPEVWAKLVKPLLAEIYGLARRHNRVVLHHSCGDLLPVIPELIGIGLDILHPIQPEAMDVRPGPDLLRWSGDPKAASSRRAGGNTPGGPPPQAGTGPRGRLHPGAGHHGTGGCSAAEHVGNDRGGAGGLKPQALTAPPARPATRRFSMM